MIPKLIRENILANGEFRNGLRRIADAEGQPVAQISRQAERYLKEIATSPSRLMIGLAARFARVLYRRSYGAIHYDRDQMNGLWRLGAEHPIVFLPSHKSNFDRLVLHYLLWENDRPPNYTAGGINMNFFPVGPIFRRAGVFFIRRTFTHNLVYRFVLQAYFGYLIEQRVTLEWYIEGGRSRTGKLRYPRYGLLGYAADALTMGRSDDIYLIPTSISYDHVHEIDTFAAEESGTPKKEETFTWLIRTIRSLRKRQGNIHLRMGEPLSMRRMIDPSHTGPERRLALQKLASEVCERINLITPITPTSLVVTAIMSGHDEGMTRHQLKATLDELIDHAESRNLPSTEPLSVLRTNRSINDVMGTLVDLRVVVEHREAESSGSGPTYRIRRGRRLAASYYRNTVVHFFLPAAVAELSLTKVGATGTSDPPSKTFYDHVARMRDLLAFEFFFGSNRSLTDEITSELDRRHPQWEDPLVMGSASAVLERMRPHRAPWVLRPFLEAYLVVAEGLAERPVSKPWHEPSFLRASLDRATGYVDQGRIAAEAASLSLFANAIRTAAKRDLLEPGPTDIAARRAAFADELNRALALVGTLDARLPDTEGDAPDGRPRIRS